MSDILRSRSAERTARVWQPADFLNEGGQGEAFVPKRWRPETGLQFERMPEPQASDPLLLPPAQAQAAPLMQDAAGASQSRAAPQAEPPSPEGGVSQQALEEARVEAYQKGLEHGRREGQEQARQAQEAGQAQVLQRLSEVQAAVHALGQSPEQLHEPLKRLALHLAEQLVLAELSQSPQAIERLVRRCVDELGSARAAPVRIDLHPDDLALLQPWLAASRSEEGAEAEGAGAPAWQLHADSTLRPGSVRASAQDAVVSDLIEHRLEALARQLRVDPVRASRQSAFQPERIASRRAEVDHVLDAQPRMAEAPRNPRFRPVVEAEASLAPQIPESADMSPAPWAEDAGMDLPTDPEPSP